MPQTLAEIEQGRRAAGLGASCLCEPCRSSPMGHRQGKRALQQSHCPLHVFVSSQKHANPTGVRKDVMRFCLSGRDNLISQAVQGKGCQPAHLRGCARFRVCLSGTLPHRTCVVPRSRRAIRPRLHECAAVLLESTFIPTLQSVLLTLDAPPGVPAPTSDQRVSSFLASLRAGSSPPNACRSNAS